MSNADRSVSRLSVLGKNPVYIRVTCFFYIGVYHSSSLITVSIGSIFIPLSFEIIFGFFADIEADELLRDLPPKTTSSSS